MNVANGASVNNSSNSSSNVNSPATETRFCRVCGTAFEVDLSKRGRRAEFCDQTCRDFEALRGRLEAHAHKIASRIRPEGAPTSVVTESQRSNIRTLKGDLTAIASTFNRIPLPAKAEAARQAKAKKTIARKRAAKAAAE